MLREHLAKCAKAFIEMGKGHKAAASCHDGLSKASAEDYHGDLRDAHNAMAGACADLAQCCIDAASETPDVAGGGIDRHATEMGGTDFSAVFAAGDMSKSTPIPRPGAAAPIGTPEDLDVREIFGQ